MPDLSETKQNTVCFLLCQQLSTNFTKIYWSRKVLCKWKYQHCFFSINNTTRENVV